jgi:FAD/FMN-containing dehydrogenase
MSVRMTEEEGLAERIEAAVYDTVSLYRGSISAEHGIGSLKKGFLRLSRSPEEVALMRTRKRAMDPNGILNPGKIF